MTHRTIEAQATSNNFDALAFEINLAKDYEKSQRPYVESDYEIDSDLDWCGSLYRVWKKDNQLLGTFYQKQGKWFSNPHYQNGKYQYLSRSQTFRSNELAIRHIISSFEGC
ncbi:MAG: hypothetical protein AB4206_21285 [Xenococcaceae cyanobacterium]